MQIADLIAAIDSEIERLQQARTLLAEADTTTETPTPKRGPGRPKGTRTNATTAPVRKPRVMSAEGKARIAAAQKKRWAARKAK